MRLFLVCLTLICSSAFARVENTFVGNPADGVEIDGRLFLRDLFTRDLHQKAYVGNPQGDVGFPRLPDMKIITFAYPTDLLERKLKDLNQVCPGLGDAVLATIKLHNWILIDEQLTELPDPADPIRLPAGAKWVPIANRLLSTIRIHRASWERLAPEHQVALIIHEALYSLQQPRFRHGIGIQSGQKAREMTANFFSEDYLNVRRPSEVFNDLAGLSLGGDLGTLAHWRRPANWKIDFFLGDNSTDVSSILNTLEINVTSYSSKAGIEATYHDACDLYIRLKANRKTAGVCIATTFTPRLLKPELRMYTTSENTSNDQSYVLVSPTVNSSYIVDALTNDDCRQQLRRHFDEASDSNW